MLTTSDLVRHRYFVVKALQELGSAVCGCVIQEGIAKERPSVQTNLMDTPSSKLIRVRARIQTKKNSLAARLAFSKDAKAFAGKVTTIPHHRTTDINSVETEDFIRQNNPDLLLVCGGAVIKRGVLSLFPRGAVNLHTGMAPDYRGSHCIEWPLYHGHKDKVGYTVHYIGEALDGGDILKQAPVEIRQRDSLESVYPRCMRAGIEALIQTAKEIRDGHDFERIPQAQIGYCYTSKQHSEIIRIGAAAALKNKSRPRRRIENKIARAVSPLLQVKQTYKRFLPVLPHPVILLYHNIGDGSSPYLRHCDLTMRLAHFREQIDALSNAYEVVSVKAIYDALQRGERPINHIAFSFDDGNSGIKAALSLLKERGLPATLYVNSDFVERKDLLWRSKLSYLLSRGHVDKLACLLRETLKTNLNVKQRNAFQWTKRNIRDPRIEPCISKLFSDYGDDEWKSIYLDWEDLRQCDRSLIHIGNHSKSHLCLSSLNEEDQRSQIHQGQRAVLRNIGNDDVGFSIPFGERNHYSESTIKIALEAHTFFLSAYGGVNVAGLGRELRRVGIPDVPACHLPRILLGALSAR